MRIAAGEHVLLDARRHGVVLLRPLLRSVCLAALGGAAFLGGWPYSVVGAVVLTVAAATAALAVIRWDQTRVVLTSEKLFVVHGVLRRRAAAVHLARVQAIEVEQSLPGRLLGYGTLLAGDLEIDCVPHPLEVYGLVEHALGMA
jgi:uncharacterized membrane protein YdbT with pleckstrin-like domain